MRVGVVDADMLHRGKVTFPNLALMKLSAWHKMQGDFIEWYSPLASGHMDRVYVSKVFSDEYTPDISFVPDADEVIYGGSGYAIKLDNGIEHYCKERDQSLAPEIEHIKPDYGLYGITDTAYGFLTKGCQRGCKFCHVAGMQGKRVHDFSPLSEFWGGEKRIKLLDPNITASQKCVEYFNILADTKAEIDFTQGLDLRLMTPDKWDALNRIKLRSVHFAWDNPDDVMEPMLRDASDAIRKGSKWCYSVYVLTNFNSSFEQDLHRVETIKSYGFLPYVMIYNKSSAPKKLLKLQRYANNIYVNRKCKSFSDYKRAE